MDQTNTRTDYAAQLAVFLTDRTGSCMGTWRGPMSAKDQRALIGRYMGKGRLVVNGTDETVAMYVSVCFGTMRECRECVAWRNL